MVEPKKIFTKIQILLSLHEFFMQSNLELLCGCKTKKKHSQEKKYSRNILDRLLFSMVLLSMGHSIKTRPTSFQGIPYRGNAIINKRSSIIPILSLLSIPSSK
eukprot:NODE_403_length_9316_cov_0.901269.p5 type:complete len:103 gc:universal NODE_403_length_9316_cov_0.901269:302-610(+)